MAADTLTTPVQTARPVSRLSAAVILGIVAVLPVAALWSFRASGFVSDDFFFAANFWVSSWSDLLFGAWPHGFQSSKAWRPLVLLTYRAQQELWLGQPEAYHVFNYAVHGVNAALLTLLAQKVSRCWRTGFIAGTLFAVHPMIQENVLWISGRTYPLSATFLLALCVWTIDSSARRALYQHSVGVGLMVMGLAAYEFGIIAPALVAAVMWVTWKSSGRTVAGAILALSPYVAVLCAYFLFRWGFLSDFRSDVVMAARSSQVIAGVGPIYYRLPHNTFLFSWRLLDWPIFTGLDSIQLSLGGAWTTLSVVAASVTIWRDGRLRTQGLFWLAFCLVCFVPVAAYAGFTDRFGYLSIAGLTGGLATATISAGKWEGRRKFGAYLAVAVLGLLWTRDLRVHARDWQEAGALAQRIVAQTVRLLQTPTEVTDVHVIDIPPSHGSAWVFLTYFPLAVHSQYAQEQAELLLFHLHYAVSAEALARSLAPAPEHDERILVWDKRKHAMEVRFWRQAGAKDWSCSVPCAPSTTLQ